MTVSVWFFIYATVVRATVRDEVETVEVTEGATVTLRTGLAKKMTGDVILWTFGTTDTIIAQLVNRDTLTISDEMLRDILQLDMLTGSLTINNISITQSGVYKVQIISLDILHKQFTVNVYAPVSIPAIKNISEISECQSQKLTSVQPKRSCITTDCWTTSDLCSVLCSVTNGPQVSLSWITDREILKQSSNADLSVPLCLILELHFQDNHIYSCIASNPASNSSTQLNTTEFCPQLGLSRAHCCGPVVVRLVLSAVVGLASIAVLVYHFRSRTVFNRRAVPTNNLPSNQVNSIGLPKRVKGSKLLRQKRTI